MLTPRLEVRLPQESDRLRFVELFCDEKFMVFSGARGKGYATEAGQLLLAKAAETFRGEILAMIDPTNLPSQKVAQKLGFTFWKQAVVDGYLDNLYRLTVGADT